MAMVGTDASAAASGENAVVRNGTSPSGRMAMVGSRGGGNSALHSHPSSYVYYEHEGEKGGAEYDDYPPSVSAAAATVHVAAGRGRQGGEAAEEESLRRREEALLRRARQLEAAIEDGQQLNRSSNASSSSFTAGGDGGWRGHQPSGTDGGSGRFARHHVGGGNHKYIKGSGGPVGINSNDNSRYSEEEEGDAYDVQRPLSLPRRQHEQRLLLDGAAAAAAAAGRGGRGGGGPATNSPRRGPQALLTSQPPPSPVAVAGRMANGEGDERMGGGGGGGRSGGRAVLPPHPSASILVPRSERSYSADSSYMQADDGVYGHGPSSSTAACWMDANGRQSANRNYDINNSRGKRSNAEDGRDNAHLNGGGSSAGGRRLSEEEDGSFYEDVADGYGYGDEGAGSSYHHSNRRESKAADEHYGYTHDGEMGEEGEEGDSADYPYRDGYAVGGDVVEEPSSEDGDRYADDDDGDYGRNNNNKKGFVSGITLQDTTSPPRDGNNPSLSAMDISDATTQMYSSDAAPLPRAGAAASSRNSHHAPHHSDYDASHSHSQSHSAPSARRQQSRYSAPSASPTAGRDRPAEEVMGHGSYAYYGHQQAHDNDVNAARGITDRGGLFRCQC